MVYTPDFFLNEICHVKSIPGLSSLFIMGVSLDLFLFLFPDVVNLRAVLDIVIPHFLLLHVNIYIHVSVLELQAELKQSEFQRRKGLGRAKGLLMLSLKTGLAMA